MGLLCNRVKIGKFCLGLSHKGVFWLGVERQSLRCIIGGWPVVWEHGNQLSHEEKGGAWSWESGEGVNVKKNSWFKG